MNVAEKMNKEQLFAVSHNTEIEKHKIKQKGSKIKEVLSSHSSFGTQPRAAVGT